MEDASLPPSLPDRNFMFWREESIIHGHGGGIPPFLLSLPICNAGTFRTPFVRIFHLSYTLASKITGDPCLPFFVPQSVCDSLLALRVQAISAAVVSQAEEKEEKVRQKKLPNIGNAIQRGSSLSEACISILYTFEVSFSVPARSPLPLPAVSSTLQKSYFAKRRSPQNGFVSFSPVPFFCKPAGIQWTLSPFFSPA